eukprot:SAG25_NODE_942_length_4661_cov_85.334064_4_plen_50_part_00
MAVHLTMTTDDVPAAPQPAPPGTGMSTVGVAALCTRTYAGLVRVAFGAR